MLKVFIKKILRNNFIVRIIDLSLAFSSVLVSPILIIYSRIGPAKLKFSRETFKKIGIYPIRNHYYEPLFVSNNLKKSFDLPRNLPGIDLNISNQI